MVFIFGSGGELPPRRQPISVLPEDGSFELAQF
jgi:hypothetical protein